MKRGAERQISKGEDDAQDIEVFNIPASFLHIIVQEISGDGNFSKADDAVLATRK
jgi:hypothetical protein